jgi:hypothetical protein
MRAELERNGFRLSPRIDGGPRGTFPPRLGRLAEPAIAIRR